MAKRIAHNIVDDFDGDFISLARQIARLVEAGIKHGMSSATAIDYAFRKLNLRHKYETLTIDAVREAFTLGYGASLGEASSGALMSRKAILSQRFSKDFTLRESVWRSVNTAKQDVTKIVGDKLLQRQSWQKIATDIREEALSKGNISSKINELVRAAQRLDANDPALLRAYQSKLKAAERHIAKLASNNAPTKYLKYAYQEVIDATKTFSAKAMAKAVHYATVYKMQYEAERVVRTETARAYGVGSYNKFLEDADIVGVRSILSSRHAVEDVCDFYAEADLFGMGAGIFPKNYAPPYPYHPNCMCILSPIYEGEQAKKDDFNVNSGSQWLKKQSESMRKSLLGTEGLKEFNENKQSWRDNMRGFGLERKSVAII
jgi:hypothetical protein